MAVIATAAIYSIYIGFSEIRVPFSILASILVLYTLFIFHGITKPDNIELIARVFIFIPVSFTLIFLFPTVLDVENFLKFISLLAGTIVFIGIPGAIVGNAIPLISVHTTTSVFGLSFYIIESTFYNPNPFAELAFFGTISSLVWFKGSTVRRGLIAICALGLFLAQSRAAFLAVSAAVFVYVAGNYLNREYFHQLISGCLLLGTISYLMLLQLIPGPSILERIYLAGRLDIWHAAIEAVKARPILGHGPGDLPTIVGAFAEGSVGAGIYNSFLRLFVTTGVLGGLCYVYLFVYSITNHAKLKLDRESLIVHSLTIGFVVNELFTGNSMFGLSTTSVIGAVLIGYLLSDIVAD